MTSFRSMMLPAALLTIVVSIGSVAAARLFNLPNVVGSTQTIGIVLDKKWERMPIKPLGMNKNWTSLSSYRCSLQRCEAESITVAGIVEAKGFLTGEDGVAPRSESGLSRAKAEEIFSQAMPRLRQFVQEDVKGVIVGPLHGYRMVATALSPVGQEMSMAVDLLEASDRLIFIMATPLRGDMGYAEILLAQIERGIHLNGKVILQ